MEKIRSKKTLKEILLIPMICFGCMFLLSIATPQWNDAEQTGFEVGKTWGENQRELEKTYKKSPTVKKKSEKAGGVELKISKFPLSHYEAVANTGSIAPYNGSLLNIANALFSFNKFLVGGLDTGIKILQGTDFLQSQINTIGTYTKAIWSALTANLMMIAVVMLGGAVMYSYLVKTSVMGALKQVFMFGGVLMLATLFIGSGKEVLTTINDTSIEVEQALLSSGSTIIGSAEIGEGESSKDTVSAIMRNLIFDRGVLRPYLLMNYGTSNINEIEGGDKTTDDLLKYAQNATGVAQKKKQVEKLAKDNVYMDKEGVGIYPKIGYAIFSIVVTIGLGIPILFISSINLVAQLCVAVLMFILVLAFFISLFPRFQGSWFKPLTSAIGAIFLKGLTIFFVMMLFVITQTIDNAIPPTSARSYAVNSIVMMVILNWLMNNRSVLISMIINRSPMPMGSVISGNSIEAEANKAKNYSKNRIIMLRNKATNNGNQSSTGDGGGQTQQTQNRNSGNGKPKTRIPTTKAVSKNRNKPTSTPNSTNIPKARKTGKNPNKPTGTKNGNGTNTTPTGQTGSPTSSTNGKNTAGSSSGRSPSKTVNPATTQTPSSARKGEQRQSTSDKPRNSKRNILVRQEPSNARKGNKQVNDPERRKPLYKPAEVKYKTYSKDNSSDSRKK